MKVKPYLDICRPDHWIKNLFILPGILLYLFFYRVPLRALSLRGLAAGLAGLFMVASANYVFNEILDAAGDLFHPEKKRRPIPSGLVRIPVAYAIWAALTVLGILAGLAASPATGLTLAALWLAGVLYNLPPIRLKDRPYLDVISESINNSLRLLAGWYMAGGGAGFLPPPVSIILAYWMFGAYLMAVKRYAEYRFIDDPAAAGRYRRSFRFYNRERLQESIIFYCAAFAFFSGVFIARYRIELVLAVPLVVYLLAYYFHLGFKPNSPVQHPELLYREKKLMLLVGLALFAFVFFLKRDVPLVRQVFDPRVPEIFSEEVLLAEEP
jgi:decaprenyl-phosphate phosphoribosyltransferase